MDIILLYQLYMCGIVIIVNTNYSGKQTLNDYSSHLQILKVN